MEIADLPLVEVKALAEVFGSRKLNSFLKIIQGLELLNGVLFGKSDLLLEMPHNGISIFLGLLKLI